VSGYSERYPFIAGDPALRSASLAPFLPLRLRSGSVEVPVMGLIDTGATVNVLPWTVGQQLGLDWDKGHPIPLGGNLSNSNSRVVFCEGIVGAFAPRRLAFAWSESDDVPVLLGQMNFLISFDVLLSRSASWFEIGEIGTWGT